MRPYLVDSAGKKTYLAARKRGGWICSPSESEDEAYESSAEGGSTNGDGEFYFLVNYGSLRLEDGRIAILSFLRLDLRGPCSTVQNFMSHTTRWVWRRSLSEFWSNILNF